MNKRLLCLGVVAAAFQLFASGCHPVARWRANHPAMTPFDGCPNCPPILPRRAMVVGEPVGPVVGPVVSPPCHGCNSGAPGMPVSYGPIPGDVVPVTHPPGVYPNISYPQPIGGPTVVPQYELPSPMPVPKPNGEK